MGIQVSKKNPSVLNTSSLFTGALEDIIISCGFRGNEGLKSFLVEDLGHTEVVRGKRLDNVIACRSPLNQRMRETIS